MRVYDNWSDGQRASRLGDFPQGGSYTSNGPASRWDGGGFHEKWHEAVWGILGLGVRIRPAAVAMADAHMSLDIYQERAGREVGRELHLPILPVPQLRGLAIRILPKDLGLHRFITVDSILVTWKRRQTYL